MSHRSLEICWDVMAKAGFNSRKRHLTMDVVGSRLDEYAATYLLDRQQPEWHYEMTCKQVARNCLAPAAAADINPFTELLRDVIDRARGRVKKEFNKAFRVSA